MGSVTLKKRRKRTSQNGSVAGKLFLIVNRRKQEKKNPERVKEKVRRSIICWGCWGCFRDGRGVRGAFEPSASRSYHLTRHGHMTNISILYFTKQFEFNNNNFCSDENRITSANIYLFILGILCLSY